MKRQLEAQAQQHAQFSATVVAQMAAMSETLKRLAEQQTVNQQPKKRARRTTAAPQPVAQVPVSPQLHTVNHVLENLRVHSIAAPGHSLPSGYIETTEAVTNAPQPQGSVQPDLPSTIKKEPVDNFRFVASPRITIRPHETALSDHATLQCLLSQRPF